METTGITKRVRTGIFGLDKMISGGIPAGSQVLVIGMPGSGKTLLSLEILYHNAKLEIPSTFISTEELKDSIISNIENVFYAFEDYIDMIEKNTIQILHKPIIEDFKSKENFQKFIAGDIINALDSNKSKIVVFDSISSLRSVVEDDRTFSKYVTYTTEIFRDYGITSLITMEVSDLDMSSNKTGLYSTSMFDGIFRLGIKDVGGTAQYIIEIPKLRNTAHRLSGAPFQITEKGFDILAD